MIIWCVNIVINVLVMQIFGLKEFGCMTLIKFLGKWFIPMKVTLDFFSSQSLMLVYTNSSI